MPPFKRCAIVAGYGAFAIVAAFLITLSMPSLGSELAVGAAVFVIIAVLHHFFMNGARDFEFRQHIDTLYASRDKLTQDFQVLRDENKTLLVGLTEIADYAFRDERKSPKAQGELQVLRSLRGEISAVPEPPALPAAGPAPAPAKTAQKAQERANFDQAQLFQTLRDALKHERIDLFLQPVVRLPQRGPRYYECFSRIRAADGMMMTPDQYLEMAREHGLLRVIDNMLLFRCIQLVRKAQRHNHNLGFFCNISMQTLGDRKFLPQFIAFMAENRNLASRLVFELAEEDVEAQWETFAGDLEKLAKLGYRFSMDHVKHLGFDPETLASRHFTFVKVSAKTLLSHAAGSGKNLQKFRDELRRNRIELIVEKVETEQQVLELLDLDVSLAQGYLFGQPRLSRQD